MGEESESEGAREADGDRVFLPGLMNDAPSPIAEMRNARERRPADETMNHAQNSLTKWERLSSFMHAFLLARRNALRHAFLHACKPIWCTPAHYNHTHPAEWLLTATCISSFMCWRGLRDTRHRAGVSVEAGTGTDIGACSHPVMGISSGCFARYV